MQEMVDALQLQHGWGLSMVSRMALQCLLLGKQWLRNPKNLPLLTWAIGVAVSGTINVLVMIGLLNTALPIQTQRDTWSEVSNQILNALFTLLCLYEQPRLCYRLLLLIRWKPEHIVKLRKVYCKKGTHKPHEWAHMMVVVLLLQLTIFAQYAVSGLNWAYNKSDRPAIGVNLCFGVTTGAAVAAVLYLVLSPLRKDYGPEIDLGAVNSPSQVNSGMLPLGWPDMLPPAVNSASRVNSGMPPLNAQATVPTVLLGWPDILPPAVNSASRVNSGMTPLNAQAAVPTVLLGWPDILPPAVNSASRVNSVMPPLNAQATVPTVLLGWPDLV